MGIEIVVETEDAQKSLLRKTRGTFCIECSRGMMIQHTSALIALTGTVTRYSIATKFP
jgi:hypothetical protein